jgi:hypothetical protein
MSTQQQIPPPAQMMQMITGFWTSCCIYAVAKLGIADELAERPLNAAALAERTHSHEPSLYRVLRALSSAGVFAEDADHNFSLTALGNTLRDNIPGSMKAMALAQLGDHYNAWGNLIYSIKTGNTAFDYVEGMPVWKYYDTHPEEGLNFMKAMTGLTNAVIMNVIPVYDFTGIKSIVDIGGGNGALMFGMLEAAPASTGIVFDEEYVVSETKTAIEEKGYASRCQTIGGSFFDFVPEGADLYTMKMILHDWDDERSITILKNCYKAMRSNSKLLILDSVIPADNSGHPGKFMDINMLAMTGGRERTEEEFSRMLKMSGLKLNRVIHTHSPLFSIVEAVKQ